MNAMHLNRRPHYSASVARGLEKIASRTSASDADELAAITWVARMVRWRVGCAPSEPHDAAVSPTKRVGRASRPAARGEARR
jgi:hypothetical protein